MGKTLSDQQQALAQLQEFIFYQGITGQPSLVLCYVNLVLVYSLHMDYQGSNVREFLRTNGCAVLERVYNNYSLISFTQKDIEDITNGYRFLLGEGGFGKVYKGRLLDNQRPVAVKRYKNGTNKQEFAKELIVHSQINHKNVVRLLGCCTEEDALMIVMEFICNGNLDNILHCCNANGHAPFPLDRRLDIAIESAEALSYMHSMYSPVLHGDIKPANILLDENLRPKISDFGIARLISADEAQHTRNVIGCIGYMDPLFCQSGILTPKSDVYSFGVVLLEMLTRKKAAGGDTNLAQSFTEALRKGKKVRQMFDEEIASEKRDIKLLDGIAKLTAECLKMGDKIRPEMVEVADRLRTIRKVLHQRKGINSRGTNSLVLNGSGKAEDLLSPSPISMDELKEITRYFSNDNLIGVGSCSKVFFGVLKGGQKSAIKKLNPVEGIHLEIPVYSRFKHENVVQLLGYCDDGDNRALAYEYAPQGSLHDILHGKKGVRGAQPGPVLSWAQRVRIALTAASGLEFLHEKAQPCIIHHDIKSSNILLFDGGVAKIGGLGVSKHAPDYIDDTTDHLFDLTTPPRRPGYGPDGAPEHETTMKSNVYSFGVVLLELITGRKAAVVARVQAVNVPTRPVKNLVTWATPRIWESKVHTCVDPRLGGDYPPKALQKMAQIADLCVQYEMEFRPNMSNVVKALRRLLLSSPSDLPGAAELILWQEMKP